MRAGRGRNGKIARKGRRRVGSVLFVIGILSVLGTTFGIGAMAGRLSLSSSAKGDDRAAKPPPPSPPTLTFYRELTAPLTPPSSSPVRPSARPAKPAKPEPAPAEAPRRADAPSAAPSASPGTPDVAPRKADGNRYTVQVGSYTERGQAEALRARLGASGHDAYVATGEALGSTRYRVRVGTFATKEEARQAAVRLGSDAHVATFVTTR